MVFCYISSRLLCLVPFTKLIAFFALVYWRNSVLPLLGATWNGNYVIRFPTPLLKHYPSPTVRRLFKCLGLSGKPCSIGEKWGLEDFRRVSPIRWNLNPTKGISMAEDTSFDYRSWKSNKPLRPKWPVNKQIEKKEWKTADSDILQNCMVSFVT